MGFNSAQGGGGGGLPLSGGTLDDGANIALGSTTGTKIGTAATEKLGFFNATPVVRQSQPAAAAFTGVYANDGSAIVNTVNGLRTALINLGLIGA